MRQARILFAVSAPLLFVAALTLGGSGVGGARASDVLAAGSGTEATQESIVVRRLWEGVEPDFWSADMSPDGRYMTETDWVTGDLAVLDVHEGALKRVTDKGSWSDASEWAEASVFSPDGEEIAAAWYDEERDAYQLRVFRFDGSGHRDLMQSENQDFYLMPDAWSRDGRWILTRLWHGAASAQIAMVSTTDGSTRVLEEFVPRDEPENMGLSPDGRFVAYDRVVSSDGDERDLFVVAADGSGRPRAIEGPGNDRFMGWAPDGSGILFHSDRAMSEGLWWLPTRNGAPVGEARLLRSDVWRAEPVGFDRDGRFYYGVTTQQNQVHTAGIDLTANRFTSPPAPVEDPSSSRSRAGIWSPDGRSLAYLHMVPGIRDSQIVIRSTSGGGRQVVSFDGRVNRISWLSDGGALAVYGSRWDEGDQFAYYRMDLRTGETDLLYRPPERGAAGVLSPDGGTVYRQTDPSGADGNRIVALDVATGESREVATIDGSGQLRPSQDGRSLHVGLWRRATGESTVLVISLGDGSVRELYRTEAPIGISLHDATPDGGHVLFTTWNDEGPLGLWKVSTRGGAPVPIEGMPEGSMNNLRVHPGGHRVSFNSGESRGELWVVEGLPGSTSIAER